MTTHHDCLCSKPSLARQKPPSCRGERQSPRPNILSLRCIIGSAVGDPGCAFHSQAFQAAITAAFRGRAAHNYNTDRSAAATFQTLSYAGKGVVRYAG
jgi:hypothetical protein